MLEQFDALDRVIHQIVPTPDYIIKEVRHHIEVGEITTSLKLIRDSYGFKIPTST